MSIRPHISSRQTRSSCCVRRVRCGVCWKKNVLQQRVAKESRTVKPLIACFRNTIKLSRYLETVVQPMGKGEWNFTPISLIQGGPFPIPTSKRCKRSLWKLDENKQFTSFGEFNPGMQVPIGGLRGPIISFHPRRQSSYASLLGKRRTLEHSIKIFNACNFRNKKDIPALHIVTICYIYIVLVEIVALWRMKCAMYVEEGSFS